MINTVVKLKKDCLGNKVGTIGICYEEYNIGFGPGESYIFENGSYDGFSIEEKADILEVVGAVAILRDPVENVMKLSELYRNGRFDEVFKTFKVKI